MNHSRLEPADCCLLLLEEFVPLTPKTFVALLIADK